MATTKKKAAKKATKPVAKKAAPKKAAPKKAAAKKAAPKKAVAAPHATTVNVYLNFDGNCEQAFNFYKSVFGGNFSYVGRYKDMPPQNGMPIPASEAKKIMHVSLPISKETILMGCDMMSGMGQQFTPGNNFMVSVTASSRQEADRIFKALAKGGRVTMPMADMFWGSYFGMAADKFGIQWTISYDQNPMN